MNSSPSDLFRSPKAQLLVSFLMRIKELQLAIGPERFRKAARLAQETAKDTGNAMPPEQPILWQLPLEIGDMIWNDPTSLTQKMDDLIAVYQEMPCYGLLSYMGDFFESLDSTEQDRFWTHCTEILDNELRYFARPMEYFLWCDFFERGDRVCEAWDELITPSTPRLALQSILLISGPVPFDLKLELYNRLLPNPQWHHWIFLSILHSYSETNGQFSENPAKAILQKLLLPRSTPNLLQLEKELGMKPSLRVL